MTCDQLTTVGGAKGNYKDFLKHDKVVVCYLTFILDFHPLVINMRGQSTIYCVSKNLIIFCHAILFLETYHAIIGNTLPWRNY